MIRALGCGARRPSVGTCTSIRTIRDSDLAVRREAEKGISRLFLPVCRDM